MIANGCTPAKSLTLEFPSTDIIPEELQSHFMRGYFDGDGCLTQYAERGGQDVTVWTLCGTKHFLDVYCSILVEHGVYVGRGPILEKCGEKIHEMRLHGKQNIKKTMEFLYKDSTEDMRLDRKYHIFQCCNFIDGRSLQGTKRPA